MRVTTPTIISQPVISPKIASMGKADTPEAGAMPVKKRRIANAPGSDAALEKSAMGTIKKPQALNKIIKQ